jgi:hypothetical protein
VKQQEQTSPTFDPKTTLEDRTPVKLRISQTVSSADAHLNDRVEFEVLEDIKVADILIILKVESLADWSFTRQRLVI